MGVRRRQENILKRGVLGSKRGDSLGRATATHYDRRSGDEQMWGEGPEMMLEEQAGV
jgi:hypothetical protein